MLTDLVRELFAGTNVFDWLTGLAALAWALVQLGEWKRGVDAKRRNGTPDATRADALIEERLRRVIEQEVRKARHDTLNECAVLVGRLSERFDKAGEKSSELASRVQTLPTKSDVEEVWRELRLLRANEGDVRGIVASHGERIARLGG